MSEGCSGIIDLVANVVSQTPQPGVPPLFTVTGFLVDFPGNNYQQADTMAVFSVSHLPAQRKLSTL
jgi:hypothetical protein